MSKQTRKEDTSVKISSIRAMRSKSRARLKGTRLRKWLAAVG
jgi:hypothetical protein